MAPPQPAPRILVVDDDPGIRDVLSDSLGQHGFRVRAAASAAEMDRALQAEPADLVVLDLMMPGEDGLSVCRRLANGGPPVVMLSAMGEDTDRIVGLELGADDYLAKPCNPRELLARVKAVLRRQGEIPTGTDGPRLRFAGWTLDMVRRELVSAEGQAAPLSSGEFNLLKVMAERPGRVLGRDQLLDLARGADSDAFDRAIDVQISRLRKKLNDAAGRLIVTVRGEGYRFDARVDRR